MGFEDLSGVRYGRLVAVEPTDQRDGHKCVIWKCLCDCGNISYKSSRYLKSGRTQSCGCLHKEIISKTNKKYYINLINHRFGKLTVIQKTDKRVYKHIVWECKCECGNICEVPSHYLLSGDTTSCGECNCSKGEQKIISILEENNIEYEYQKSFDGCRFPETNAIAKFDFYLPDYNLLIEYDGQQHFKPGVSGWYTPEKFEKQKQRDLYKDAWCLENGIKLIRIPFTMYETMTISDILPNARLSN